MKFSISLGKALCLSITFFLIISHAAAQDLRDNEVKSNVSPLTGSLESVLSLEPKVFEYRQGHAERLKLPGGTQVGFIAEDVQRVFPSLVSKKPYSFMTGKNAYGMATVKQVDMQGLIPFLIASIKEQQAQINSLRAELERLKAGR